MREGGSNPLLPRNCETTSRASHCRNVVPEMRQTVRLLNLLVLVLVSCAPAKKVTSGSPQRIISVVPSVTEMLFAFGLADKVIGVGDYDEFPPEVKTKPRVGGLINPNIEKIIDMHPDIVITYGSQQVLTERLQSLGIRMFPFVHGNVEQTLQFMLSLGKVVGTEERAQQVVRQIRAALDELRTHAPPVRPKVLIVHDRGAGTLGSFYSVGSRAFQHDLIEIAGGRNLFGDVDSETIQPTLEEVISRRPDIILETLSPPLNELEVAQRKRDWGRLRLAGVRIYIEGESYLLGPGPRLALAAQRISELIRNVR
jgi:iron complex transport system substrate-binding protein